MDVSFSEQHQSIREGVKKVCDEFDDTYWSDCDEQKRFPFEFHQAMAAGGWLGITMPEELGGSNLGVTEAAVMMNVVSASAGGYSAASTLHLNLFGPHAIVVFGTNEQKERMLRPLIEGKERACFGVTEPNAGLDTTSITTFATKVDGGYRVSGRKIWTSSGQVAHKIVLLTRTTPKEQCKRPTDGMTLFYTDLDRTKIEVRRIPKMGRNAVDSNATFIDNYFIPDRDRIGEEGKGFDYILHGLNPERILIAAEAIGLGRVALERATRYAGERIVFDRPIGQNQAIQHPLAERWMALEAADLMMHRAAWRYDRGLDCGAAANAAKYLAAEAGYRACETAVMTHGGFGYAKEYHVERYFRESLIPRLAPVSPQLILCFIAEKVLGLPKSY